MEELQLSNGMWYFIFVLLCMWLILIFKFIEGIGHKKSKQTIDRQKEFIICAAIWLNDSKIHQEQPSNIKEGFVIAGRRHSDCYATLEITMGPLSAYFEAIKRLKPDSFKDHEGFITSKNRYVDREEAYTIALENNQLIHEPIAKKLPTPILISENLY